MIKPVSAICFWFTAVTAAKINNTAIAAIVGHTDLTGSILEPMK